MELESTVFKDGDLKSNTNTECHHHQISRNYPVKIKPEHTLSQYDQHQYFPPNYAKVINVMMNKKPTRCTIVLKSLKLYCILILLYMFRAFLRPSSGASQFCTYSLQSPCVIGLVVSSSFGLSLLLLSRGQVWVGTGVPTQTWLRPVTTCVCKPQDAKVVRAPDDERCAAWNMLSR
jgi:hypothetical protein